MLLLGYALQSIYLRPENPDMEVQVSVAPGIQMTQRNFKDALIDMAAWWALTLTLSLLTLLVYPSLEFPGLAWHGLTIGENIHLSTLLSLYYIYSITFGATILYHFFFVVYFLLPFREANIEVEPDGLGGSPREDAPAGWPRLGSAVECGTQELVLPQSRPVVGPTSDQASVLPVHFCAFHMQQEFRCSHNVPLPQRDLLHLQESS